MAKIRGIKPEFWTDEDIVELSIPARLLFIGMWNHACDNGHLDDKPRQIKMRILPGDDVNIGKLLDELVDHGRIVREKGTITIPKFAHHQKPHSRWWSTCDLPSCVAPESSTTVVKPPRKGVNNGGATGDNGSSRETTAVVDGDGDVDGDVDGELKVAKATAAPKRGTQLPKNWKPTPDHEQRALAAGLILGREVDKFRAHAEENARLAKNWNAAFTRWLMNAEEYATRNRPARSVSSLPLAQQLEDPPPGLNAQEYDAWYREQAARRKAVGQ